VYAGFLNAAGFKSPPVTCLGGSREIRDSEAADGDEAIRRRAAARNPVNRPGGVGSPIEAVPTMRFAGRCIAHSFLVNP
jgi:hypothetical protein